MKGGVVGVLLLVIVGFGLRFHQLQQIDRRGAESGGPSEVQRLFEALQAEGLLTVDALGRVIPAPSDWAAANETTGAQRADVTRRAQLLAAYYRGAAGGMLSAWIERWNLSRAFGAVRDDGSASKLRWDAWSPPDSAGDWPLPLHIGVPLAFGYLLDRRLQPGFAPWAVVDAPAEFRRSLTLAESRELTIHVIGHPDTGMLPSHRLLGCRADPPEDQPHCVPAKPEDAFDAWQIHLTLDAGEHRLRLPVRPIEGPSAEARDLPLGLRDGALVWLPERERYRGTGRSAARYLVESVDGMALTDAQGGGRPMPEAIALGLGTLIGSGPDDAAALSGLLAGSAITRGGRVTLTLDSRLQRIASQELEATLASEAERVPEGGEDRYGAVVMIDARSGAIRAVAGAPAPPADLDAWDRAAFAVQWPHLDPFRIPAWQGLGSEVTPGSTFKPVTALAAMRAVADGVPNTNGVAAMLKGWPKAELGRQIGLRPDQSCYSAEDAGEVCNFSRESLGAAFERGLRGRCEGTNQAKNHTLGLREALRDSLNIWFVRLAERVDHAHLKSQGPDTYLFREAQALGFGPPFSLFPAIGGLPLDDLSDPAGWSNRGTLLKAQSGGLDLGDPRLGAPGQRLAQNAFGQGVRATPLQMARLAAALATRALPMPTLLHAWEGEVVAPAVPTPLTGYDPALFDLLRQGMKAVPESGTAAKAFRDIDPSGACRTYGKTGTALARKAPERYSAWFVGWREGRTGDDPEVAFACLLTSLPDTREDTGGRHCGRLMARILRRWEDGDAN